MKDILRPIYFRMIKQLSLRNRLQIEFLRKHWHFPDLEHPKTYSEKIAWCKLNERDPRLPLWADKVRVKKIVTEILGEQYVLPNLWIGKNPYKIPFDELRVPYVIKTSNGTATNIFIRKYAKSSMVTVCEKIKDNLQSPVTEYHDEWHYGLIDPQILIEPMIIDSKGLPPTDFKFHVFGGEVMYIQVHTGRFGSHCVSFFDKEWRKQTFTHHLPMIDKEQPRPKLLDGMISVAETLGKNYHYVRIDLYEVQRKIFFGEATFYPGSGCLRFRPYKTDYQWGGHWDLPMSRESAL